MVNYEQQCIGRAVRRPVKESGVIYRGRVGLAGRIDAKFIPYKTVVQKNDGGTWFYYNINKPRCILVELCQSLPFCCHFFL